MVSTIDGSGELPSNILHLVTKPFTTGTQETFCIVSLGSEGCMTMDCCACRGRRWKKLVHSGVCGQLKEQDSRNLGTFCQALHFVVVHNYQVQIQPHFNFAGLIFCYLIAPATLLPT